MDRETLAAYEAAPASFASEWHDQPEPEDLHELVRRFFSPGPSADVGCGSGRDTAWLAKSGFPAVGFDPSPGLLTEARRRYPDLEFVEASLPELAPAKAASFSNVLCETVIMHLSRQDLAPAVARLFELLEPGGTLYLSWRVTNGSDIRDSRGRLYSAFEARLITEALGAADVLFEEESTSSSSRRVVHRLVARRAGLSG